MVKENDDMNLAFGLDLRLVPPEQRHELVRCSVGLLPAGQALLLTLDHDPLPLRSQLRRAWPGKLHWDYESRGPALWVVRVHRQAAAVPGRRARPSARRATACRE